MIQDEIMKLQTYKMFEGEDTVYVERDDVLEVLKQQPCEDCISRQAIDDAIYDYSRSCDANYQQIMEFIEKIPPVTPQPKTGHWIATGDYFTGAYSSIDYVKCSCCGYESLEEGHFCPFCGARMKESEDKE